MFENHPAVPIAEFLNIALNGDMTPVSVQLSQQHYCAKMAAVTDPVRIKALFEAFLKIKAGRKTNYFMTDNDDVVVFEMADGSHIGARFTAGQLNDQTGRNLYETCDGEELFRLYQFYFPEPYQRRF